MMQATEVPTTSAIRTRQRVTEALSGSSRLEPRSGSPVRWLAILASGLCVAFAGSSAFAPTRAAAELYVLLGIAAAAACVPAIDGLLRRRLTTPATVPVRVGPYTLGEKIGEGGMGVVYKASHTLLRRPTAIKLLHPKRSRPEDVRRFEREVQLTSLLTHPNTIAVYDFGRTDDGSFYYAMEYVDGLDLQTLVEREGPQSPARVAHWLAQLAGALAEAHAVGLIHRDIKPANVMVCERGGEPDVIKVLDFGLIAKVASAGAHDDLTHSDVQTIVGTPLYLSPEALTRPEAMDGRSDLYAVGALGYFLLTGVPPFSGDSVLEVCAHHLHTKPVPPSKLTRQPIPPRLEELILACLDKSMDRRPESAAALRDALLPLAREAHALRPRETTTPWQARNTSSRRVTPFEDTLAQA